MGYFVRVERRPAREDDITRILGRSQDWRSALGHSPERFLREPRTVASAMKMQLETPLTAEDLIAITEGPSEPLELANFIINVKQPRWLIGWRDITNATNERTVIASIFPKVPMGNTAPLIFTTQKPDYVTGLIAVLSSITFDFVARQKIGGTHMSVGYIQQFPVPTPSEFSPADLTFLKLRVLELTYTSHSMRLWAEDLGYLGRPFAWDEGRRALLRAELDAFLARKYGLTREELRYVLDPSDIKGPHYPSETFRGLKAKEEVRFGEYRTGRY